jgi:uncharacterized protein (TIGR02145 family)
MKKLLSFLILVLFAKTIFGQVPESFKYQAVLRDASGNVRANASVSINITILQGSTTGTQVFLEVHDTITNEFGLVNLEIGSKNPSGFEVINWANGPYFIKVNVDGIEMGTSQLLSVPYALYAKTAENVFSGDYNDLENKPDFTGWDTDWTNDVRSTGDITIDGEKNFIGIITVPTPVNAADAANKAYVDQLLIRIEALEALIGDGVFLDTRDNNYYGKIKIGNQTWMAENLAYLPSVSPSSSGSYSTPYYYVYGYEGTNVNEAKATSNYTSYGVLYNWFAAMAGETSSNSNPSGIQGVCPSGWHLPSDAEWTQLTDYLGGVSIAGGKLKEAGYVHWESPNTDATNESGFTALPGGYCNNDDGIYSGLGNFGGWWSSTINPEPSHPTYSFLRAMYYNSGEVGFDLVKGHMINGFAVRCVKD